GRRSAVRQHHGVDDRQVERQLRQARPVPGGLNPLPNSRVIWLRRRMQKRFLRAALISATLLASAIPAAAQTGALPEKVAGEIAAPFADFARENPVPGMVYVVMKDGKVALSSTSGVQSIGGAPVAMDSRFRIASMSKAFTGLAILKLRDEGKLSLDDLAE